MRVLRVVSRPDDLPPGSREEAALLAFEEAAAVLAVQGERVDGAERPEQLLHRERAEPGPDARVRVAVAALAGVIEGREWGRATQGEREGVEVGDVLCRWVVHGDQERHGESERESRVSLRDATTRTDRRLDGKERHVTWCGCAHGLHRLWSLVHRLRSSVGVGCMRPCPCS